MEFRACRSCGEDVEPLFQAGPTHAPIAYICENGHQTKPEEAEREVRCPSCKKKLADHLYGHAIVTCPRCKTRSPFDL